MARVFIFAQHVQTILDAGSKEIEVPEGARISAAADDLIKDNQIQIKIIPPQAKVDATPHQAQEKAIKNKPKVEPSVREKSMAATAKSEIHGDIEGDISDEQLEEIVNRVVERFKQLKDTGQKKSIATKRTRTEPQRAPANDDDLVICRCEEITKGEIKEAIRNGMHTLNGIKRITRAGMGLCQGETCQRLVTQILVQELGLSPAEVEPTTARGPVRPLRLEVFANS